MFLNAVNYMAGTVPGEDPPTLAISRTPAGITLTYTGTLQAADAVTGAWADVAGATSPWAVTTTQAGRFYRAKR